MNARVFCKGLRSGFRRGVTLALLLVSLFCGPVSYTHLDVYKRQGYGTDRRMVTDPARIECEKHLVRHEACGRGLCAVEAVKRKRLLLSLIHIFGYSAVPISFGLMAFYEVRNLWADIKSKKAEA